MLSGVWDHYAENEKPCNILDTSQPCMWWGTQDYETVSSVLMLLGVLMFALLELNSRHSLDPREGSLQVWPILGHMSIVVTLFDS